MLTANDDSTASLSYALNKFKDPSATTPVAAPSPTIAVVNGLTEMQTLLNKLRMQSHNPMAFAKIYESEMPKLGVERLPDRAILLREIFTVLRTMSPELLGPLLATEQQWLVLNLKKIKNAKALDEYIQTLVLVTARSYSNHNARLQAMKNMASIFKKDAYTLKSFRTGLVGSTEWDIQDIFNDIPNDLKNYVQGKRK